MLKLTAEDQDDLTIISAQMQDAALRAGDMRYLKKHHQFALVGSRFAWDAQPKAERRRTGLTVNSVLEAQRFGFAHVDDDTVLSLLSILFEPAEQGAGKVVLTFSGGFSIRLGVECLDVQMSDLGPVWDAASTPEHDAS